MAIGDSIWEISVKILQMMENAGRNLALETMGMPGGDKRQARILAPSCRIPVNLNSLVDTLLKREFAVLSRFGSTGLMWCSL